MEVLEATRRITEVLLSASTGPLPRFRAWDGSTWGDREAAGTIVLAGPHSLPGLLSGRGDVAAGEAYVFGDVDLEGDVFSLLEFAAGMADSIRPAHAARLRMLCGHLPPPHNHERMRPVTRGRLHSIGRDGRAVSHHYDTGNDFFELFLDPNLVYSCAYFLAPDEDLATAQERKLDVVCRKLTLGEGMRFLDVGCGWGALVIHAAAHYGVQATGVTLSRQQADAARRRVESAGLEDRVTILQRDYRQIDGEFDAIASVGMVEHVGRKRLGLYFQTLRERLAPGGQLLNHGIVRSSGGDRSPRTSFVRTYVFPDGDIRPLDELVSAATSAGFDVRDIESLRVSYAHTLRAWVRNLEERHGDAVRVAGEQVYRIWRLYMAGSAVAFERNDIGLVQMLAADPRREWRYGRSHLLAADDNHPARAR